MRYLDADGAEHEVTARHVILGAGAFETPAAAAAELGGIGNPDVVGRYLMFHLQTYVLGIFPFRLHSHRGRSVTHLMDDPIVPDDEAQQAARDAGLPYIRGGHRRARRRLPPDRRGDAPPAGATHHRG